MLFGLLLEVLFLIKPFLNPFDNLYFDYHDITQPARLQEFFLNLINFKIPPRVSPNFLYGLSYPVFNFYAPFSYWLSSLFMFLGFNSASAVEASFALALIVAFVASYKLFRLYFDSFSSLLAASVYVSSPYIAVEIFIRGNLGEVWFWALLPASLYFLKKRRLFLSFFLLHALFTAHNIFSLLAVPFIFGFLLLQKKRRLFLVFFLSLLSTFYFWLPVFFEMKYVLAKKIAEGTRYFEHFLCINQLWSSEGWYFGASVPGCKDYMSFKLGKGQVILGVFGLLFFIFKKAKRVWKQREAWYFLLTSFFATFLTLYVSEPVWKIFEKFLAVVQFPWRFLLFSLFGLAFFSGYFLYFFKNRFFKAMVALVLITGLFTINKKYFFKPVELQKEFFQKYLSEEAIKKEMAFKIPEYFTIYSDYKAWRKLREGKKDFKYRFIEGGEIKVLKENLQPFAKKAEVEVYKNSFVKIGILYFPFWKIKVDGKEVLPERFDQFGRPEIKLVKGKRNIEVSYSQTLVEKVGNSFAIASFLLSWFYLKKRSLKIF